MINREQFLNGLVRYIDAEVIPQLPTQGKWVLGTMVTIGLQRIDSVMNSLFTNPIILASGVIDRDGLIDSDLLIQSLKTNAEKYGKLIVQIPVVGTLTFSSKDVEKAGMYIGGAI